MSEELKLLPGYLTAHLQLSLFALLLATLFSVPSAIIASRRPSLGRPLLWLASTVQTVPSLALLALMVPLLSSVHLPSIGQLPAFVALVLYSMLPILRGTLTGLQTIDPAALEAADAVGMAPHQRVWKVELPLALPVIVAGLRTASVWTVGMATLSTPVGGTSLGNFIFTGLQTRNYRSVLVGCVSAAVLALFVDALFGLVELTLKRRRRWPLPLAFAGFGALYAYAGLSAVLPLFTAGARPIVIGAKTFSEQFVLGEMMAEQIRRFSGRPVEVRRSLGSSIVFDALSRGQIDAYVDYSGTLWTNVLQQAGDVVDRRAILDLSRRLLRERYDVELLGSLGFENAYALAMRRSDAERLRVESLSDLAPISSSLSIGGDYEFFARPEWKTLVARYGFAFRKQRSMDPALMYQAIAQGAVDVVAAFSSDGRIASFELTVLKDDRHAIPPYDAVVLVAGRTLRESPAVARALQTLLDRIDPAAMRQMNRKVDERGENPRKVALDFLAALPGQAPLDRRPPTVSVESAITNQHHSSERP